MTNKKISGGVAHKTPSDLRKFLLAADKKVLEIWQDITPLARNEWICWVSSAKKEETRIKRINQAGDMLAKDKRRPCCWPGCPHR